MQEHKTKDWNDKTIYPEAERLNKTYGNRKETLGGMLIRRNKYLIKLFSETNFKVELHGKAEAPQIIINGITRLSAYVHNFKLYFTKDPSGSEIIHEMSINYTNRISQESLEYFLFTHEQGKFTP